MKHIGYRRLDTTVKKVIDLDDPAFLAANPEAAARITTAPDGTKNVLRWQCDEQFAALEIGERFSMNDYSHFCFWVYSEKATGTTVRLHFNLVPDNDRYIQGGSVGKTINVDFEGWKEFRVLRDHLTVAYPPPFFTSISLKSEGGYLTGKTPENVLYFTSFTAEMENLEIVASEDVDLCDESLYEPILQRFENATLGSPDVYEMKQYLNRVSEADKKAEAAWDLFKSTWCDGEKGKLFNLNIGREPWVDEPKITTLFTHLYFMALSYRLHGSKFEGNKELLCDIKKGLEYGYVNYYGENLYNSTLFGNWWPWWVGTPMHYVPLLVLLRHELGFEATKRYCKVMEFLMPFPYGSGCNMIDMTKFALLSGALAHNAERICRAKSFVMKDLDYFTDKFGGDGGFYEDGSFIQHNAHPYARGYGVSLIQALVSIMNFMQNTPFEFTEPSFNNQFRWVFENFRHQIFHKNFSANTAGRSVTRGQSEIDSCAALIVAFINMRSYAPSEYAPKLDSLIRRLMLNAENDFSYKAWAHAKYCTDLYSDDSIVPEPDYLTTRVFGRMARVAHHNKDFGAALSLSSPTISKYESINGENQQGWYFSDGFIFVYPYKTGYNFDGSFFCYGNPYLRPGVTANTATRNSVCIGTIHNASPYAGGVEMGKYGSAGFILKYDKTALVAKTHKSEKDINITAKKSWFFFDNEIVCVGTGVKDTSETEVNTCVDNRLWHENDRLSIDGKELTEGKITVKDPRYAHFTNMGGYVFLDTCELSFEKATHGNHRKADDEKTYDFAEILVKHGKGNESLNGSYAYAYLPEASEEETAKYSASPDVEILCASEKSHAVYEKALGIFAVNFFEADTVKCDLIAPAIEISAKTPCMVMICDGKAYLSDPTSSQTAVELAVNGKEFKIDTSEKNGKTFSFKLN